MSRNRLSQQIFLLLPRKYIIAFFRLIIVERISEVDKQLFVKPRLLIALQFINKLNLNVSRRESKVKC